MLCNSLFQASYYSMHPTNRMCASRPISNYGEITMGHNLVTLYLLHIKQSRRHKLVHRFPLWLHRFSTLSLRTFADASAKHAPSCLSLFFVSFHAFSLLKSLRNAKKSRELRFLASVASAYFYDYQSLSFFMHRLIGISIVHRYAPSLH